MRKILFLLFLSAFCILLFAQDGRPEKLKVFIDCKTGCDRTFIISEIRVVDFLLDRLASDVHVLINSQPAGSGGRKYQIIFYGQNNYRGHLDTLFFTTDAIATAAEARESMVHTIKLGLIPFIAKTPYSSTVRVDMKGSNTKKISVQPTRDKWNYWVFRVGTNGEFNGEKVYKSSRYSTEFSANRTTEKLKTEFYVYGSRRKSHYEYAGDNGPVQYEVENSDYGFFHNLVRSFDSHWSYGYQTSFSNNTFSNYKSRIYFNPAIEYNVYPYQEVNNRFFVVRYGLDATRYNYYDTTIYNKLDETLLGHRFSAALTLNQRWGTFNSGLYFRNFFNDWSIRSMGAVVNVNVRITGGLSFQVYSTGSIVHDQVYLQKGGATEQEVLTRRRQLASSYNYRTSFGVNYRFGSKLNNFINPRFDGYGGF